MILFVGAYVPAWPGRERMHVWPNHNAQATEMENQTDGARSDAGGAQRPAPEKSVKSPAMVVTTGKKHTGRFDHVQIGGQSDIVLRVREQFWAQCHGVLPLVAIGHWSRDPQKSIRMRNREYIADSPSNACACPIEEQIQTVPTMHCVRETFAVVSDIDA